METNSTQWPKDKVVVRKTVGGLDLNVFNNLAAQVSLLTKRLQKQQGGGECFSNEPLGDMRFMQGTTQQYGISVRTDDCGVGTVCG